MKGERKKAERKGVKSTEEMEEEDQSRPGPERKIRPGDGEEEPEGYQGLDISMEIRRICESEKQQNGIAEISSVTVGPRSGLEPGAALDLPT